MSDFKYIHPVTKIHSTFTETEEFFEKYGGLLIFNDEKPLEVSDIAQGKYNLIVGEPGVGKTELIKKIKEHFDKENFLTKLISLRQQNTSEQIDLFLALESNVPKVLLLDGLDEVRSSAFPLILQKIDAISKKYPDLPIYLSSRWVFIKRYASSFPEYRFITISPFTQDQAREYLLSANHTEKDIDILLNRIMSFNHSMLVIQIPRYLFYLEDFLKKKDVDAATKVSRNELFEHFIYSRLDLEGKKLNEDKKALIKRVLEKLALTMEIYQTNVLSKDEFMTFFDEVDSDLKIAALSQISMEVFYDYSLLKNNGETIEFDNAEFQEYLAAKEITRLPDPNRAVFSFAVDSDARELYPTWYNALTFMVDMQTDLLEQLIEYSGLRGEPFRVVDDSFFDFLSRVDPQHQPDEFRKRLFIDVVRYHHKTIQWLPGKLTSALPGFYDQSLEKELKVKVEDVETKTEEARFVPLANIAYIVAYLLKQNMQIDRPYWRKKLVSYTKDTNENGVLQRHAFFALEQLGDPSVIDELPSLTDISEEMVRIALLDMCIKVSPDHPKCLKYFFEAVRRDDFHGRYGIFAMKERGSIKKFLEVFNTDEDFRREFLDDTSIFRDDDYTIVKQIESNLDDEIRELCKKALVLSANYRFAHNVEQSAFIDGLWKLLRKGDSNFVVEMVERIKNSPDGKSGLYFAHNFFSHVIEEEDVGPYIDSMIAAKERRSAFSVMHLIKLSKRANAKSIYEAGRLKLSKEYKEHEQRPDQPNTVAKEQDVKLLREFNKLLEPEPKKFSNSVFGFYNRNVERLTQLNIKEEKVRLIELIIGTVFKFVDPAKHDLTITKEHGGSKTYTTDASMFSFGNVIITAKHLGIDLFPYRQQILNFIPFAHEAELKTIFEEVKDVKSEEMGPIIDVYKKRKSDLWRHQTISFVEAVEQYHVVEATSILKGLVKEKGCDKYARQKALLVLELLTPDSDFLIEIFNLYKASKDIEEEELVNTANGLLITSHGDKSAIKWRLSEILKRAAPFIRPTGGHNVSELESELDHDKKFAKPLMDLKHRGYEDDYLKFLEAAMEIWKKGREYHAYTEYIWGIVYAYFENLKEKRSYEPLHMLEQRITEMKEKEGVNWLASRMVHLRRAYLTYLGKPRNVSEAIRLYNEARSYDDKKITNSDDLFRHLQDAFETDLKDWIEGEGAYNFIVGKKVFDTERQGYEKLVQVTLKPKIEQIMSKRGFRVSADREVELLDGKQTDFLVRYGFVGPIVVEVKLTSNSDLKGTGIEKSTSYSNMKRYMQGYGASHGIVLIIDNIGAKNLALVKVAFQKIQNVWVKSFSCHTPEELTRKPTRRSRTKK